MAWVISRAIAVSFEAVDTETGERRDVEFEVVDEAFATVVDPLWRKSFDEIAWQATHKTA